MAIDEVKVLIKFQDQLFEYLALFQTERTAVTKTVNCIMGLLRLNLQTILSALVDVPMTRPFVEKLIKVLMHCCQFLP